MKLGLCPERSCSFLRMWRFLATAAIFEELLRCCVRRLVRLCSRGACCDPRANYPLKQKKGENYFFQIIFPRAPGKKCPYLSACLGRRNERHGSSWGAIRAPCSEQPQLNLAVLARNLNWFRRIYRGRRLPPDRERGTR